MIFQGELRIFAQAVKKIKRGEEMLVYVNDREHNSVYSKNKRRIIDV